MRVLAAIADAEEPIRIDPRAIRWEGEGEDRRAIVRGHRALAGPRPSAPGARSPSSACRGRTGNGTSVLVRRGRWPGSRSPATGRPRHHPTSSPRPCLHPVRTLAGVALTARHPADHDWHLGVGVAIPDVNGTSFWGGGTYLPARATCCSTTTARSVGGAPEGSDDGVHARRWTGSGTTGRSCSDEQRSVRWAPLDHRAWRLTFDFTLTADATATLNSPGSKGRVGGGYGGFAWRFPECADVQVFTAEARGEDEVHGRVAPWLAWSADFAAGPGQSGPATVVIAAARGRRGGRAVVRPGPGLPGDRLGPGLGPARGAAAGRRAVAVLYVAIADGRLSEAEAAALADELLAPANAG